MALDEPNEMDQQFSVDGFEYIVNKEFLQKAQPISVDFHMYGFKLDSGLDFSAMGGSCSGCGSSCSC